MVIAALNLWDFAMNLDEITYMSYGCGERLGNVMSWLEVRNKVNGDTTLEIPATCKKRKGNNCLLHSYSRVSVLVNIALLLPLIFCSCL